MRCLWQPAIPVPEQLQYPGYATDYDCAHSAAVAIGLRHAAYNGVYKEFINSCVYLYHFSFESLSVKDKNY